MNKISASISIMADIFISAVEKFAGELSSGMLFYCKDDKTVLLTKRSNNMTNSPGTWDIPGGRYDDEDDSTIDTATREVKEEISELPSKKKLLGKHVLPKNSKCNPYVIFIYSISKEEKKRWTPKIDLDHESSAFKWFPYDKLPKKTHFGMDWVKSEIDGLT